MPLLTIEIVNITVFGSKKSMVGYIAAMDNLDGGDTFCRVGHTMEDFLSTYPSREDLLKDVLGCDQFRGIEAEVSIIDHMPTVTKPCALLSDIVFRGDEIYNRVCDNATSV